MMLHHIKDVLNLEAQSSSFLNGKMLLIHSQSIVESSQNPFDVEVSRKKYSQKQKETYCI
jgi:hypothetical protein